ncbi:MAG TPA: NrfD/PsrC family molybdoenzyme membrane anchor subunit [Armatimonadota bacterium]|nr:NrfD/PsrC family molybdoenzyme membrane anchor subunit [Armatimonadota bacterium]
MTREAMHRIDDQVLGSLGRPSRGYLAVLAICAVLVVAGAVAFGIQYALGMGVTGLSIPVGWAVYITNYVWWIGVAMSGTFISAMLFLFKVNWRSNISRVAETMTIFAIASAGLFPLIHLGRVWVFYWILPYPNTAGLWPNFKSPLVWDVFAIVVYLVLSLLIFYLGLLPDLATARDRTQPSWRRTMYAYLALGWTGKYDQWRHWTRGYLLIAAMAMPLAMSVHSIVSWDFAMGLLPGWHETIFAPYFVAGAVLSGFALIILLLVPLRKALHLENIFTVYHFEQLAKLMILMALILGYCYGVMSFMSWYSGDRFSRQFEFHRDFHSRYSPLFWAMILANFLLPLTFFSKRLRTNLAYVYVIALVVEVGLWIERFVIIVPSLAYGFLPSSWGVYAPRLPEIALTGLSFGLFLGLFLVFVALFPSVAMYELKEQAIARTEGS